MFFPVSAQLYPKKRMSFNDEKRLFLVAKAFVDASKEWPEASGPGVLRGHGFALFTSRPGAAFPWPPLADQLGLFRSTLWCPAVAHGLPPIVRSSPF